MLKIMKIWQIVKEQEQQKEENTFLMAIFYVNFWKNLQYLLWHLFENVRKKVRKKSRFGWTPNRTVRPKGTFVWTLFLRYPNNHSKQVGASKSKWKYWRFDKSSCFIYHVLNMRICKDCIGKTPKIPKKV